MTPSERDLATARAIVEKWYANEIDNLANAIAAALEASYNKGFEDGKAAR